MWGDLLIGLQEALTWQHLGLMFLGTVWGFIGGALPGIQASTAMALILPITWGMSPSGALMMLAAVYVSAEYSHSVPAILIRTPGTSAAVVTTFDGYPLQQQGKGGKALSVSLYGGFIGQIIGTVLLIALVLPLSTWALSFGPPEFFALGVFGLTLVASLGDKNVVKALMSGCFGIMIADGRARSVHGDRPVHLRRSRADRRVEPITVLVGLLAVSEIFTQARDARPVKRFMDAVSTTLVTWAEFRPLLPVISWTSVLGMLIGALPGAGATIASLVAYSEAKRWSRHPEKFGHGSLEGVAAPETANNSAISGAMVPLLAFGVPGSASAAIMIAALMLHGITPGPMLFENNQEIVYGLFVALFIATFMMLIMGWVSIKPLLRLVAISKSVLLSCILTLVFVGVYTHNGSLFDIGAVLVFGVIGYLMNRYGFSPAACVLGFVLGTDDRAVVPALAHSLRRESVDLRRASHLPRAAGRRPRLTFAVPFFRRAKEVLKSPPSPR